MHATVAGSHVAQSCPTSEQGLKCGLGERQNLNDRLELGLNLRFLLCLLLRLLLDLDFGLLLNLNLGSVEHKLRLRLGLWFLLLLLLGLGGNNLSRALDKLAILGCSLDQPVIAAIAGHSLVDTCLAKIEVAIVTGGAVVVHIRNGLLAVVAADSEVGTGAGAHER